MKEHNDTNKFMFVTVGLAVFVLIVAGFLVLLRENPETVVQDFFAAQSFDSVPPAPELILRMAPSWSSSLRSMLRTSRFSTRARQVLYCLSRSSSVASPSLKNSYITVRSSTAVFTRLNSVVQLFSWEMFLRSSSACFGSFQKPGCCVWVSFSDIS